MSIALFQRTTCARIPTEFGSFQLCHYLDAQSGKEHLALVHGDISGKSNVITRVHSECFTGDVLGSLRCDCGEQLHTAMRMIAQEDCGLVIYLRQEGRGIGLEHKLRAYNLQDQGYDTVEANLMLGHQADEREYTAAAIILEDLQVDSIRVLTNNPAKIESLQALGVVIEGRIPLVPSVHAENEHYLNTKVRRMRHLLALNGTGFAPNDVPVNDFAPLSDADQRNGMLDPRRDAQHAIPARTVPEENSLLEQLTVLSAAADAQEGSKSRPFVTLTYAQTLDGAIANCDSKPMTISGPEAMRATHALRTRHDAILVGIGTVLADNPRLTARLVEGSQPQPVILDTRLRIPQSSFVFHHPKGVWIATHLNGNGGNDLERAVLDAGGRILDLPLDAAGQLDLVELLANLYTLGIRRLMVEGGSTVIRSFLQARLVDFIAVTIAPRFTGGRNVLATDDASLPAQVRDNDIQREIQWPKLTNVRYSTCGQDMMVWGQPVWSSVASANPAHPEHAVPSA